MGNIEDIQKKAEELKVDIENAEADVTEKAGIAKGIINAFLDFLEALNPFDGGDDKNG